MNEDLQKHTLHLFKGDYETLQVRYPEIGAARVIRELVRKYIIQLEGAAQPLPDVEVRI